MTCPRIWLPSKTVWQQEGTRSFLLKGRPPVNLWKTLAWAGLASPPQFSRSRGVLWFWTPFEECDEKLVLIPFSHPYFLGPVFISPFPLALSRTPHTHTPRSYRIVSHSSTPRPEASIHPGSTFPSASGMLRPHPSIQPPAQPRPLGLSRLLVLPKARNPGAAPNLHPLRRTSPRSLPCIYLPPSPIPTSAPYCRISWPRSARP